MAVTFEVSKDYGYVLCAATSSFVLGLWHAYRVAPFRKAAGVPYPNHYAYTGPEYKAKTKEDYVYNCAQRAHYQFLENYHYFLPSLLISGLQYPLLSTGLGVGWMASRLIYAIGYTRAEKERGSGRLPGLVFAIPQLALIGLCGKMGFDLITS